MYMYLLCSEELQCLSLTTKEKPFSRDQNFSDSLQVVDYEDESLFCRKRLKVEIRIFFNSGNSKTRFQEAFLVDIFLIRKLEY